MLFLINLCIDGATKGIWKSDLKKFHYTKQQK